MRVGWISDLHADQNRGVGELVGARAALLRPDVLIVAGDISHHTAHVEDTLRAAAAGARAGGARAVFFVAGNHDLWVEPNGALHSADKLGYVREACARAGVTLLGGDGVHAGEPAYVEGPAGPVAFCGVPGWYDYSLRSRWLDAEVTRADYARKRRGRLVWQDVVFFRWPRATPAEPAGAAAWADDETVARLWEVDLAAQLASVRGRARRAVVATHFLPFKELVTERTHPLWDFLNAYMGSEGLGHAILGAPEVALALAGHTHIRREARLPRPGAAPLLAATSPLGYPRERACTLEERVADRLRVVDLDGLSAAEGPRPAEHA